MIRSLTILVLLLAAAPALAQEATPATQEIYAPVVLGERTGGAILLPDGTMKRFVPEGLGENVYKNYPLL